MQSFDFQVVNTQFETKPSIIHAHGSHDYKPNWQPIRDAFFEMAPANLVTPSDLTIITCNNGHQSMGLFEKSLDHLGLKHKVYGNGINPWVNSKDKPIVLFEALKKIKTKYVLYADSRDAILIDSPTNIIKKFEQEFECKLLFGADRINWPPLKEFQAYEDDISKNFDSDFRYFNGGAWIGETDFCRDFFEHAMNTPPAEQAPESEQGILKKLFPLYKETIELDYNCKIIQNIGFVTKPIFNILNSQLNS